MKNVAIIPFLLASRLLLNFLIRSIFLLLFEAHAIPTETHLDSETKIPSNVPIVADLNSPACKRVFSDITRSPWSRENYKQNARWRRRIRGGGGENSSWRAIAFRAEHYCVVWRGNKRKIADIVGNLSSNRATLS